ncbi:MAG: GNAT family N-acetyltransferase [Ardenticatenaceae bacterium]|nr:GNAT family N-acetyltransferase [Ardenticatenaceae bacterium]
MTYTQVRSIREIDEARWDAVTGDYLHMSHRWLRATEACQRFYKPCYLLLENKDGPYAAVLVNTSTAYQKKFGWLGWLYHRFNLVVRSPFSAMCSVLVKPGVCLDDVMPEMNAALNDLSRQEKRLLITVGNVNTADLPSWQKGGFQATPKAGVNMIDLPTTYEEYLAALPKKQQRELRRIYKRAADFDIHIEAGPLGNDSAEVYALLCEVFVKHGLSPHDIPFTTQFLDALSAELPDEVSLIRGYAGDKLVGVSFHLLDGPRLLVPLVGLHYEIARPSLLYFVLMNEAIRWGIEHGYQQIDIGMTNEREKRKQGFHLEERWVCHRAHIQPLNWAIKLASNLAQNNVALPPKLAKSKE